jgi:hypothetical protein
MANQVGQELLNVPFADMVKNLALAIAEGQSALDTNSIATTEALAEETIKLPGIPTADNPTPDQVEFPLIALGIPPTFYQFREAIIEVKIAITMAITTDLNVTVGAKAKFKAFSASVNASYSRKYDYKVEGSSLLRVTLAPIPPPKAMQDYIDAFIQAKHALTPPPTPVQ